MKLHKDQNGSHILAIVLVIVVVAFIGFAGYKVMGSHKFGGGGGVSIESWKDGCSGTGTVTLQHAPMDLKDVSTIMPAGLLAGAHVTPIDHLYFYPKDMKNRDAAPVYAMADGYIVDFSERTQNVDAGTSKQGEYRIVMQHTCSFYTYFDLMTSMNADLLKKLQGGDRHVAIKAGQELGRVGAQSLDTAVYNLDLKLPGFVNPDTYSTEPWKIHLDNFFAYFKDPLLTPMLALNARKVEPYGGKIDYDIAGKLRGNWFKQGTNGYAGPKEFQKGAPSKDGKGYWSGHFSIAPDAIDPVKIDISFGDYQGKSTQFTAINATPDPAKVGVADGVVKYELTDYKMIGISQDSAEAQQQLRAVGGVVPPVQVRGTVLLQVLDGNMMKMEAFPNKKASEVTNFTSAAATFTR